MGLGTEQHGETHKVVVSFVDLPYQPFRSPTLTTASVF